MGVKLSDIIQKKRISFDQLENKKIAVDFSNAAYQFLSSIRQRDGTPLMDSKQNVTSHLQGILSRSLNLLSQKIKICYVFDGPPPDLKHATQQKRKELKIAAKEKFEAAKEEDNKELMLRYSKQSIKLTKDMCKESKELIQALGMPTIDAPSEADAQIAFCCKNQDVWAAATTDFDVLLHQCPQVITNLTLSQKRKSPTGAIIKTTPEMMELNQILSKLNITQDQLISLALLVGTDYNSGIKGIGPKKGLKIIQEFKTPKKIFSAHKLEDVDWQEVFELFKNMEVRKKYDLTWEGPNIEKVLKILVDRHDFSEQRVLSSLNKLNKTNVKINKDQKGLGSWM
jgi:flap endonuclease-1